MHRKLERKSALLLFAFCLILGYPKIHECGRSKDKCASLPIKTRAEWGGLPSRHLDYRAIPVKYVVIHHTVSNRCNTFEVCSDYVQNIQDYHMNAANLNDIGYNFLVGNDGNIYEGTGWLVIGAHTYGYNTNGTGIAFIGDFTDNLPSAKALTATKQLLECGVQLGYLNANYELFGGKQLISTKSPGRALYNEIRQWDHWTSSP